MVFTSVYYFLFFISYFLFFNFIKSGYRLHLVVVGSLIFYGWGNPAMIFVPVILSAIAFWGGEMGCRDGRRISCPKPSFGASSASSYSSDLF